MANTAKEKGMKQMVKYRDGKEMERYLWESPGKCPDCGVAKGKYHIDGCDWEDCPRCGLQFISCDCEIEGRESNAELDAMSIEDLRALILADA